MVRAMARVRSAAASRRSLIALAGTVAGITLAGGLPVSVAQAAACPETQLVQPFVKWEDSGNYSLVAGGDFEAGEARWMLSGGASIAPGGAPSPLTGTVGRSSLQLPPGAVAYSPLTCVEPSDRTFRFLDRSEGSSATLAVSVVYRSVIGPIPVSLKNVSAGSGWEASPVRHTGAALVSEVFGGVAYLSIRLESIKGTARIDDVYLDPRLLK